MSRGVQLADLFDVLRRKQTEAARLTGTIFPGIYLLAIVEERRKRGLLRQGWSTKIEKIESSEAISW